MSNIIALICVGIMSHVNKTLVMVCFVTVTCLTKICFVVHVVFSRELMSIIFIMMYVATIYDLYK